MRDAVVAAAVLALALAVITLANGSEAGTATTYRMTADVVDSGRNLSLGISVDRNRIDFGAVPARDLAVEKTVRVANRGSEPVSVTASVEGNISRHVTIDPERLELDPGAAANLTVTFHASRDLAAGTRFAGTLRVRR